MLKREEAGVEFISGARADHVENISASLRLVLMLAGQSIESQVGMRDHSIRVGNTDGRGEKADDKGDLFKRGRRHRGEGGSLRGYLPRSEGEIANGYLRIAPIETGAVVEQVEEPVHRGETASDPKFWSLIYLKRRLASPVVLVYSCSRRRDATVPTACR